MQGHLYSFLTIYVQIPKQRKKIWPFELYLIRMIYKKSNLVVILYKMISYCRIVYHRELSWASRSIAWWYQMNHQGKVMTSLINQDVFAISISLLLDQRHKCYTIRRVSSRGTNQLSMIFSEKPKEMPQNITNINQYNCNSYQVSKLDRLYANRIQP